MLHTRTHVYTRAQWSIFRIYTLYFREWSTAVLKRPIQSETLTPTCQVQNQVSQVSTTGDLNAHPNLRNATYNGCKNEMFFPFHC